VDTKKVTTSKNPGKRQTDAPPPAVAFRLVHFFLGAVLIAAGSLKLYQLAFETQDESLVALFLMVFAEAELLGGAWLVGGFDPVRTHPWIVATFAGLAASSLFQAMGGKCSCGCFGGLTIHPRVVLVFDLAAIAALLAWRPPATETILFVHPVRLLGYGLFAAFIGVVGWRQADLVTVAGRVTADGRPLEETTVTFTGDSGQIVLRTDRDGNFRLPFVRPGFYAVSTPGRVVPGPITKPERVGRVQGKKKGARRSEQRSAGPSPSGDKSLLWIEVPNCSEYDKIIKF
jgi:hypothetical protein